VPTVPQYLPRDDITAQENPQQRLPISATMPKAEVGSTKYLNNKLKSKGLQRLRWFCQVNTIPFPSEELY
jgi:hypothetical protein